MTWLTWRLHRFEAGVGVILFAAVIAVMLLATRSVDSAHHAAEAGNCFANGDGVLCADALKTYYDRLSNWGNLTTLLHGVPLAAAGLIMIPTLQELERGTQRLAWTQSISRRRWSIARIGFVAGTATLVAAIWVLMTISWRSSILPGETRVFGRDAFDLSPAVLFGYGLFAVALAFGAAVVVRRLVPVLTLTIVGFIGTRIFTTFVVRPHYRPPVKEVVPAADDAGAFTAYANRWILDESWLSKTGQRLSWDHVYQLCNPGDVEKDWEALYQKCLTDNGLQYFRSFQPTDRIGQFQLIETVLYLGVAAALFAFAYWWLTRRSA
jgi:hypothetical protein